MLQGRLQTQGVSGRNVFYKGPLHCFVDICKTEGVSNNNNNNNIMLPIIVALVKTVACNMFVELDRNLLFAQLEELQSRCVEDVQFVHNVNAGTLESVYLKEMSSLEVSSLILHHLYSYTEYSLYYRLELCLKVLYLRCWQLV